jgi:hypothetical protein
MESTLIDAVAGARAGYPAVKLKEPNDGFVGRIVDLGTYQAKDYQTGEPKTYPSGDPVTGIRVTLETTPGDEGSRVMLWAEKWNMLQAISYAVKAAGARDLEVGGDLAVVFTGLRGRAHVFSAEYSKPE